MCASIGVYEKFKLEAYADGTKFHFSQERFCVSPWGLTENGTHPPLAESGEVFFCWLWQWRIERVWSIRQVRLYHQQVLRYCLFAAASVLSFLLDLWRTPIFEDTFRIKCSICGAQVNLLLKIGKEDFWLNYFLCPVLHFFFFFLPVYILQGWPDS